LSKELKRIAHQNEVIISLLGRLAFTPKKVEEIVTSNKQKKLRPKYINGYNALDGKKSVSEIANMIGITQGTLSPILAQWEELGIIYEIERSGGKFYRKIFPI